MIIKKLLKGEKGAVTVLMAAAMVALVGIMALVTDAGFLFLNRTKMSNALDCAVLAGVQELPEGPDKAIQTALSYAQNNGLASDEVIFDLNLENYVLTGQATRNVDLFFARVLGFSDADVFAQSKARITTISEVEGIAPFGVLAQNYTYGEEIILKSGPTDNLFPGWFNALSLGNTGGDAYRKNIANGYSGAVKIGQFIPFENGNMSGPTKQGIKDLTSRCNHIPQCTFHSYNDNCPRIIIVPLLKIEGTTPVGGEVLGFGAFFVDSYVGTGNENEVKGSFIRYVVPGKADETLNTDYGVYSAQLCR